MIDPQLAAYLATIWGARIEGDRVHMTVQQLAYLLDYMVDLAMQMDDSVKFREGE